MKILGGSVRGRLLASPSGQTTRPMLARVKNSLFNIVQHHLAGSVVLDLFAGSGALGLEALSRGADFCLFVENHRPTYQTLKANITRLGFQSQAETIFADAFKIMPLLAERPYRFTPLEVPRTFSGAVPPRRDLLLTGFNLVFIAPPYRLFDDQLKTSQLFELLDKVSAIGSLCSLQGGIITTERLIIVEHSLKQLLTIPTTVFTLKQRREYGQTVLTFLS